MGFLNWIKNNPAAITGGVVAIVNFLISYGVTLTQDQAAFIATAAGAVITIVGAAVTRPVGLGLIIASVTTIAGGLSAFHFTLRPDQISNGATLLALVLAAVFHFAGTPVGAWKKGTDATTLARGTALAR